MRTLCAFQMLLGLGAAGSGVVGVVMWTAAYSAFLPAVWHGLWFFICGWWGFRALGRKNRSNGDMMVAMSLTVTSVPVAMALLSQALCDVTAYMPLVERFFETTPIGTRPLTMECLVVDVTMVTCACLQMIVASTAVARMRKVMRAREDESLVRSFYRSPSGPAPPLRLPVTHAWSYTPSGALDGDIPGFDKDRQFLSAYGSTHGYPLPHISPSANCLREPRTPK